MDNDKGACDNLNRYARPLFHDLQRRVKMKPGQCPVPPVNDDRKKKICKNDRKVAILF